MINQIFVSENVLNVPLRAFIMSFVLNYGKKSTTAA